MQKIKYAVLCDCMCRWVCGGRCASGWVCCQAWCSVSLTHARNGRVDSSNTPHSSFSYLCIHKTHTPLYLSDVSTQHLYFVQYICIIEGNLSCDTLRKTEWYFPHLFKRYYALTLTRQTPLLGFRVHLSFYTGGNNKLCMTWQEKKNPFIITRQQKAYSCFAYSLLLTLLNMNAQSLNLHFLESLFWLIVLECMKMSLLWPKSFDTVKALKTITKLWVLLNQLVTLFMLFNIWTLNTTMVVAVTAPDVDTTLMIRVLTL